MGGPNLEVFKFGLYLFVPIVALLHFGDPQWYHNNVLPYKDRLFPPERMNHTIPTDQAAIREQLEAFKAERRAKNLEREAARNDTDSSKRLV